MKENESGRCVPMVMEKWICLECHYIYDPAKGDKTQNIPPGTSFEALPNTWRCPECKIMKVKKGVFKKYVEGT